MANGKTDAMAPKKNAAPAMPAQSLSTTIQNVIKKAVTSPNDPKIDFAQGVNHITGDAHQKRAGKADSMQTLKASYIPEQGNGEKDDKAKDIKAQHDDEKKKELIAQHDDDKKKELKANADKEKEVKEQDEKEKELKANADKEKEVKKEGELPPALKKAIDAKKDKEAVKEQDEKDKEELKAQDEKDAEKKKELKAQHDDDKKDVKEQDEKDKEELKAQDEKDAEKKKELKAQHDDEKKDVKEDDEGDDKKKELKAQHDDEKKSAKEKVKDIDMKEDVKALVGDESDLSEEFKQKAATIFEAAVKGRLVEEIDKLESEYATKVSEGTSKAKEEIVEKVDAYLNYVVEEWMKDNELAIEKGLRSEISEDFISGLKNLFESHYIDMPAEKYNVIENQAAEIEELKKKLDESVDKTVELNSKVGEFAREDILQDVASDLADTEKDKLKGLAETIEYNGADDFRKKVETIKDSYFPKTKANDETSTVAEDNSIPNLEGSMAAYTAAISNLKNKKTW